MKRTEKDQKTGETPTPAHDAAGAGGSGKPVSWRKYIEETEACLLYTSDAADEY